MNRQPFHIVGNSPWPIFCCASIFCLAIGLVKFLCFQKAWVLCLGVFCVLGSIWLWVRDIIRESTFMGNHNSVVKSSHYMAAILFICSEVMFFFSFFWSYFYLALGSSSSLGYCWPPVGIETVSATSLPLLNTMLLLSSGVTITWSHHSFLAGNLKDALVAWKFTMVLSVLFMVTQLYEYAEVSFTIADSVYGSCFFTMTGFHGVHVSFGFLFMVLCFLRMKSYHFSPQHHVGLESCIWYWHLVDVVWVLLYLFLYCWKA